MVKSQRSHRKRSGFPSDVAQGRRRYCGRKKPRDWRGVIGARSSGAQVELRARTPGLVEYQALYPERRAGVVDHPHHPAQVALGLGKAHQQDPFLRLPAVMQAVWVLS